MKLVLQDIDIQLSFILLSIWFVSACQQPRSSLISDQDRAVGAATVYMKNPRDGALNTFTIDVDGSGVLINDYFISVPPHEPAFSEELRFDFEPGTDPFLETSVFVHANEQRKWFAEHGWEWPDQGPLHLYPQAVLYGSVNNFLYFPLTPDDTLKISIGAGDGRRLQNLCVDRDIVSHELGHHYIAQTLSEVRGESLVLHEGLADYFAFASSDDTCFGESVCAEERDLCEVEQQCLRSATDTYYILGENTPSDAHSKSQFLSGMLWDIRTEISAEIFDRIVIDAVKLLLPHSGYNDFILALVIADDRSNAGVHCEVIYDHALRRGLRDYIYDFSCDDHPDEIWRP